MKKECVKFGILVLMLIAVVSLMGGLVAAKTCMNNSDCPPVYGNKYCNTWNQSCQKITFYVCVDRGVESLCVVDTESSLICENCTYGCSEAVCIISTCGDGVCIGSANVSVGGNLAAQTINIGGRAYVVNGYGIPNSSAKIMIYDGNYSLLGSGTVNLYKSAYIGGVLVYVTRVRDCSTYTPGDYCASLIVGESEITCPGDCISGACGNGVINAGEVCDSTNLGGKTCQSQGYDEGTLSCCSDCTHFDLSKCYNETRTCNDRDAYLGLQGSYFVASNVSGSFSAEYGPACPGSGSPGGGGLGIGFDSCNGSFNLIERICNVNNSVGSVTYACPDGCSNGACMSTPIGTCSRNQSGQMRCRYYGPSKGGPAIWTQRCIVRGRNSQGAWTNIAACPYGCASGICASAGSGGGGGGSGDYSAGYLRSGAGFWSSFIGWFKGLFS